MNHRYLALQALRTVKQFDMQVADKYYIGLIKDLHHMNEAGYTVSDGYDVAQTAICFLYQFMGRNVNEIYGKDKKGIDITIKLACYRETDKELMRYRRKVKQTEYIDFTNYKALHMDPINCFARMQSDYKKADALMDAMHLTDKEKETLEYYMNGWKWSEIARILCVTKSGMDYRKLRIRYKYRTYISKF